MLRCHEGEVLDQVKMDGRLDPREPDPNKGSLGPGRPSLALDQGVWKMGLIFRVRPQIELVLLRPLNGMDSLKWSVFPRTESFVVFTWLRCVLR